MEYLITHFGSKACCIVASILGALFNYNKKKLKGKTPKGGHINWLVERKRARQELAFTLILAIVTAEFFIPPLLEIFNLSMLAGPAIAFFIGYSGMRFLPMIETKIEQLINKKV
jgi:hypothetical protein